MTRKTFLFSLMIALVALGGLAATATTADSAVQLPETVQAASATNLEQTGEALNLEPASQVYLSSCTRAECFQELLLCDAGCASYPPNDQPLCYAYCDEQFFECIASCG